MSILRRKPKTRSPLEGASANEVKTIRAAVNIVGRWEREIPHHPSNWPTSGKLPQQDSMSRIVWAMDMFGTTLERALRRLEQRGDYGQIYENIQLERLRSKSPAAYELRLLREALIGGNLDVTKLERGLQRVEAALTR